MPLLLLLLLLLLPVLLLPVLLPAELPVALALDVTVALLDDDPKLADDANDDDGTAREYPACEDIWDGWEVLPPDPELLEVDVPPPVGVGVVQPNASTAIQNNVSIRMKEGLTRAGGCCQHRAQCRATSSTGR